MAKSWAEWDNNVLVESILSQGKLPLLLLANRGAAKITPQWFKPYIHFIVEAAHTSDLHFFYPFLTLPNKWKWSKRAHLPPWPLPKLNSANLCIHCHNFTISAPLIPTSTWRAMAKRPSSHQALAEQKWFRIIGRISPSNSRAWPSKCDKLLPTAQWDSTDDSTSLSLGERLQRTCED